MLQDEALIVRLSISKWTARKFDRSITRRVNREYGADEDAGRYNKLLIDKKAIKAVDRAADAARSFHYDNTLPWDDFGGRLLPSANFLKYSQEMRKLKDAFEQAVQEFVGNYQSYLDSAKGKLNGMFNPADYPSTYEIERKFGFDTDITPVPYSEDFRVKLQKHDQSRIEKALEEANERRLQEATRDLYVRIAGVVKRFAETLSDPEAVFRNSLVDNAVELVNLLPKLNVSHDPELEKLRKEVSKKLASHEPQNLREVPEVRAKAAKDADAILKKMSGFLGQ